MAAHLGDAELQQYSEQGYLAPIRVIAPHEAETCRIQVERFVDECVARSDTEVLRTKAHLHCPALFELVHLPLTESTVDNGALQVVPASHRAPLLAHGTIDDPANMLSRGQSMTSPIAATDARSLVLDAGEMSIHHVRLAHGSAPNRSRARRMGFAIRYVAAHVRKTGTRRDTAILVRGTAHFGNFDPEATALSGPGAAGAGRG